MAWDSAIMGAYAGQAMKGFENAQNRDLDRQSQQLRNQATELDLQWAQEDRPLSRGLKAANIQRAQAQALDVSDKAYQQKFNQLFNDTTRRYMATQDPQVWADALTHFVPDGHKYWAWKGNDGSISFTSDLPGGEFRFENDDQMLGHFRQFANPALMDSYLKQSWLNKAAGERYTAQQEAQLQRQRELENLKHQNQRDLKNLEYDRREKLQSSKPQKPQSVWMYHPGEKLKRQVPADQAEQLQQQGWQLGTPAGFQQPMGELSDSAVLQNLRELSSFDPPKTASLWSSYLEHRKRGLGRADALNAIQQGAVATESTARMNSMAQRYRSPSDIRKAYKAGELSQDDAVSLLRQHGYE